MAFIGLIFLPANAEQAQELYKKTVAANLTSLAALGVKKIGSKEISKLLRESQKTTWVPLDVFWQASGGLRSAGLTLYNENGVLYRPSALESTPNGILRVFIVHEGLSALGLNDEDYAVSLSLEFLVRKELQVNTTPELQKLFRDQIERAKYIKANRGYLADSGGTSVGGGGEPDPIDVKYHLLIRAMKHTQAVAFAKEVLNARIEVDNQNTIQEKNGYKQGRSGNKFHFMFRASDWQSDDQFKILLLNHVQKRLEEQIP